MAYYSYTWTTDENTTEEWSQSSFENDPTPLGFFQKHLRIWLGEICDPQLGGQLVAGSGYQDGVYPNVDLTRAAFTQSGGENMKGTVTVTGGGVSNVEITQKGNGFKTGDYIVALNLAQVGGTGGGFQAEITSADATIGIINSFDHAAQNTYPVMLQVGYERRDSYTFGQEFRKTSDTSTTYTSPFNVYNQGTANNGYGNWSQQLSSTMSFWRTTAGPDRNQGVWYSTTPGNRYFAYGDDTYGCAFGFVELLRPANTTYPAREDFTPWACIQASSSNLIFPNTADRYNTAYSGWSSTTMRTPSDFGVLFSGDAIYGRSYIFGYMPESICSSTNSASEWNKTILDGGDVYRRVSNTLFVKEGDI